MSEGNHRWFRLPRFYTWIILGSVLAAVAIALISVSVDRLTDRVAVTEHALENAKEDRAKARKDRKALYDQVKRLGGNPVVPASPEPSEPGPAPDPDPPWFGLDEGEVRAIVADELEDRQLVLSASQISRIADVAASQIPRPKDGSTPTDAEVRQVVQDVVAEVCANDACRGEAGEDSTVPGPQGPQGPGPTDEQIEALLAAYCAAHDDCRGERGEKGEKGDQGDPGQPGRGIESGPDFVRNDAGECVARTAYTDGSVYTSPAGEAACPLLGDQP